VRHTWRGSALSDVSVCGLVDAGLFNGKKAPIRGLLRVRYIGSLRETQL
jgi:hypothetical protein